MPVTPPIAHPGVYIQEIPSGVRTVTGVPTSITAFLGRAPRGPVNEPVTIFNYGDYERTFGGLHPNSTMSYAVNDFFLNGGGQAIIVRLYGEPETGAAEPAAVEEDEPIDVETAVSEAKTKLAALLAEQDEEKTNEAKKEIQEAIAAINAAQAQTPVAEKLEAANTRLEQAGDDPGKTKDALTEILSLLNQKPPAGPVAAGGIAKTDDGFFAATSPGSWGNRLKIEHEVVDNQDVLDKYEVAPGDLFTLKIFVGDAKDPSEVIGNVTIKAGKRQIDRVLEQESALIRVDDYKEDYTFAGDSMALAGGAPSAAFDINTYKGSEDEKTGLYALEKADLFNILCIPPDARGEDAEYLSDLNGLATAYCVKRRAIYVVDPPIAWAARKETAANTAKEKFAGGELGISGEAARNAALYFPRVIQGDPLREGQPDTFPACGIVAGVMARTDASRGVWKAPAGLDAAISGIRGLQANLTDAENGILNPLGINCLRTFPNVGTVIWGARTLRGADQLGDEYKYLPVRRLALFIEETLFRSTQWAVFEPNDEPLWAQLRLNIGAFMHDLFRQGAFQGNKPSDAYFVRCDSTTTTQSDINKGIVNIMVGFAPLKPAEFVIIYLQQMAGDLAA